MVWPITTLHRLQRSLRRHRAVRARPRGGRRLRGPPCGHYLGCCAGDRHCGWPWGGEPSKVHGHKCLSWRVRHKLGGQGQLPARAWPPAAGHLTAAGSAHACGNSTTRARLGRVCSNLHVAEKLDREISVYAHPCCARLLGHRPVSARRTDAKKANANHSPVKALFPP